MARLYAELSNDVGSEVHKTSNQKLVCTVYFGSKDDSIIFAQLVVQWDKHDNIPHLTLNQYPNTKLVVNKHEGR